MKLRGLLLLLCCWGLAGQQPAPAPAPAPPQPDLNLLGRTDAGAGESRRNENVQFNLIDNNSLKELNARLGTTATLVEEFRADRSYYSAEFGNRPGGTVFLAPAKGAGIHGNLFGSHVTSLLNARSFFTAGDLKPAHENHYGFSMSAGLWNGGWLAAEGSQQRIRGNVNGNVLAPKADERTPVVTDAARRALLERFIAAFPNELPNRTDINERALNTNAPQRIDDDIGSLRLDQALGDRGALSARYSFTGQAVDAFQLVAGQNPDTTTKNHNAQLSYTRPYSSSLVLTVGGMFDRTTSLLKPEPNAVGPQVSFANVFTTLGPGSAIPIDRILNRFRNGGMLSGQRGGRAWYAWYAGGELTRRQFNGSEVSSHRGNLYFRNDFGRDVITNFLLGTPSRFSGGTGNVHRGFRQWEAAGYGGGTLRVRPDLNLTLGIRYELVTQPTEVNGINHVPYSCDCNNVSPRFGFAWRLPGKGGLMRGAYGLHYGEIFTATYNQIRFNPPEVVKFELVAPDLLAPFTRLNAPADPTARAAVYEFPPDLTTPYSHQYNFAWEPGIGSQWRLQLGYAGSRTHRLLMLWYTNRAKPVAGVPQTTATVNERRPDQRYYDVRRIINGSVGYFDAARVTLLMPRVMGWSMDASYWFSKSIDLGAPYTGTASTEDTRQSLAQTETGIREDMKGPSAFDHRHAMLVRASWESPGAATSDPRLRKLLGHWELSAVLLLKTGTPFTVITGSDAPGYGNVDGDNGDRPHLLDPAILARTINHPDRSREALPASGFAFPKPEDARGNLGVNTFRKDGISNINAAVARRFSVRGERWILFRAEAVNLLNTPQFAEPWRELASPNFGFITNTLNEGRAFHLMLRFGF